MAVAVNPASAGGAATTGTGRVGNVDVLRALAAFGVLAGHAYLLSGRVPRAPAEHWYDVVILSGASGVWLFFAISGYVISKPFIDRLVTGQPLPDLVPYALRRGLRIFPLYWICLTAVIVIGGPETRTSTFEYPVHYALLHNLLPGRQSSLFSVAWTLTIEVLFYAAVPLLALALRRRGRAIRAERLAGWIVASYLASVAFTVMGGLSGVGNTAVWLRVVFPAAWQMFCPGILLALAPHLQSQAWKRWLIELPQRRSAFAVAAVLMVAAALLNAAAPLSHGVRVFQLLTDASRPMFAIAFGIVLAAAVRARPWFQRRGRWVLHLGLVSYGIYLFHAVILDAFFYRGVNLTPLPHDGLLAYGVHLVFLVALTIPVAMVSWRWFEHPLIRLAGTLSKRWRARGELARAPSAVP